MAQFFRKRVTRRRQPLRRRVKRARRAPVARAARAPLRTMVRRAVQSTAETKCQQKLNTDFNIYDVSAAGFGNNVIELGPNGVTMGIPQGVGQGQRVGNRIRTKNIWVKGSIYPYPVDAGVNPNPTPHYYVVYVLIDKQNPNFAPQPATNFFQDGSTVRAMTGNLIDMMSPINTDRYTIYAKRILKVGYANYNTATTGALTTQTAAWPNNDFKFSANFSINLTKAYPKNVRYQDASNQPTSRGLWLMVYPISADGVPPTGNTIPGKMEFMINYEYSDV